MAEPDAGHQEERTSLAALIETMHAMLRHGEGLLATDESNGTCKRRFASAAREEGAPFMQVARGAGAKGLDGLRIRVHRCITLHRRRRP